MAHGSTHKGGSSRRAAQHSNTARCSLASVVFTWQFSPILIVKILCKLVGGPQKLRELHWPYSNIPGFAVIFF